MSAAAVAARPTQISVTFEIVTPDQLRKITFVLSHLQNAADDSWSVMFELDERTDAQEDFQLVIQLEVDVDQTDSDKAAATAANGLDSDQHAQALVAADTAKDATDPTTGVATADAQSDAAAVVSVRAS